VVAAAAGEDTVDLSTSMVGLLEAQRTAEANLQVLRTGDEMSRKVLDVFG
jgi:flagellar hook protein FlgE